jgi:hypothetical protein
MGFQVDRVAYRILILVKEDRQMRSQINPTTTQILALVKGVARWDLRLIEPPTLT